MKRTLTVSLLFAVIPVALSAQSTPSAAKTRIPPAEYAKWETLGNAAVSPGGTWVAYDFRRVNGTTELRYRPVGGGDEQSVRMGSNPVFSANDRWLVYTILPDTAGGQGGRGGRAGGASGAGGSTGPASRNKVGIVDLESGRSTVLEDVQSYALSRAGTHVALRRYPPQGRQERGADLVVRELAAGADITLGNVADYAWNSDGSMLAMTIDVDGKTGNGVQLLSVKTNVIRSLDAGDMLYSNLVWRPRSDDLAVLRSRTDTAFADTSYTVLAWRGLGAGNAARQIYDFTADTSFPKELRVASYRAPQWSEDGATLFVGLAHREPKPARRSGSDAGPQPARVEVWHAKDLRTYHTQNRQSQQDRQRTYLAAWHLAPSRLVRLTDDLYETVQLSENRAAMIAWDEKPYVANIMSGRSYRDAYRVDLATGKREKVGDRLGTLATLSPSGRYLTYGQKDHVWVLDLTTGSRVNLTGNLRGVFVNMEDDHPVHERRPYGWAGWTTGEKSLLL